MYVPHIFKSCFIIVVVGSGACELNSVVLYPYCGLWVMINSLLFLPLSILDTISLVFRNLYTIFSWMKQQNESKMSSSGCVLTFPAVWLVYTNIIPFTIRNIWKVHSKTVFKKFFWNVLRIKICLGIWNIFNLF